MKKGYCILLLACLLTGCGTQDTFETVADDPVFSQAEPMQVQLTLPEETVLPVMETDTGRLYFCRGFEIGVQTMAGGDLDATIRAICGFGRENVQLLETSEEGMTRYDLAWSSAGESGDQVGRAVIYGDGAYHYCVTAMTDEDRAGEYREIWNGIFETVTLG